jgi:hypothetical protein
MARSTNTQQALNLNAAHGLLSRGSSVAGAATLLAQERSISLRQAYRYLQDARALGRAMPVGEPSVPATFKIPRRRACATARVFQAQRFAVERDCHRSYREAFDRNAPARKTWLSVLQSVLQRATPGSRRTNRRKNTPLRVKPQLRGFARQQGFSVPDEWVIEDEGVQRSYAHWPRLGTGSRFGGGRADRRSTCLFTRSTESKVCISGASN